MQHFSHQQSIIPLDAFTNNMQSNTSLNQKLIELYEDEIFHFNEGGNPAAASDILRILDWVLSLEAMYTDLDRRVRSTKAFSSYIEVEKPILYNLYNILEPSGLNTLVFNNDIIAVVDFEAAKASGEVQKFQQALYNSCTSKNASFYESCVLQQKKPDYFIPSGHSYHCSDDFSLFFKKLRQVWSNAAGLWEKQSMANPSPVRAVRHFIHQATQNREEFNAFYKLELTEEQLKEFQKIQLRCNVLFTTGPNIFREALFGNPVMSTTYFNEQVKNYSIRGYQGLAFPNCLGEFDLPREKHSQIQRQARLGVNYDASWLPHGLVLLKQREQKILRATKTIAHFFKSHSSKGKELTPPESTPDRDDVDSNVKIP
ncbi:hypothetical protein ELY15_10385 [Legionella sp. km772]|nr:hypothetical protein ELY15_10385 [Legionella sp. km772]